LCWLVDDVLAFRQLDDGSSLLLEDESSRPLFVLREVAWQATRGLA
jgi:hypothetical protein